MFIKEDGILLSAVLEKPSEFPEKCPLVIVIHGFTSCKDKPHTIRYRDCQLATIPGDTHSFDLHQDQMADVIYRWLLERK